jgi:hypothetical protein
MAHDDNDLGEGHSPAAWTAVIIMLVAFAAGTLAFWFDRPALVWAAVGLLVLGPIVGKILSTMGYGVNGSKYLPKAND